MDYGVQLPTWSRDGTPVTLDYLTTFVKEADQLGYKYLSLNDHFGLGRPMLDPITAMSAVAGVSGSMRLVPSIMLLVNRGIVPSAKYLATLDWLTDGRAIAGVGPGSQDREYEIVGLSAEERWPRFEEACRALRSLLDPETPGFKGKYYDTEGVEVLPYPVQKPTMPIWIGSWGSDAGLRRVARLADGWLGSALDSTPERYRDAKQRLDAILEEQGKDPETFPNAVSTMALFISDSEAERARVPSGPERAHREGEPPHARTMVGSIEECREKVARWRETGAGALLLNPFTDGINQMRLFMDEVASKV